MITGIETGCISISYCIGIKTRGEGGGGGIPEILSTRFTDVDRGWEVHAPARFIGLSVFGSKSQAKGYGDGAAYCVPNLQIIPLALPSPPTSPRENQVRVTNGWCDWCDAKFSWHLQDPGNIGENPAVPARPPAPRTKATRKANLAEVEARYRGCVIWWLFSSCACDRTRKMAPAGPTCPTPKIEFLLPSFLFVCLLQAGPSQLPLLKLP